MDEPVMAGLSARDLEALDRAATRIGESTDFCGGAGLLRVLAVLLG